MSAISLQIHPLTTHPADWQGDALAVGVFLQGRVQPAIELCGESVANLVRQALSAGWIRGKVGDILPLPLPDGGIHAPSRLVLIGLGDPERVTIEGLRAAGARLIQHGNATGIRSLCCLIPRDPIAKLKPRQIVAALAEGAWMGDYRFERFRSPSEEQEANRQVLHELTLALPDLEPNHCQADLTRIRIIQQGVRLARDLGNLPPNHLTPAKLAEEAMALGERLPIRVTILDEQELAKEGMNGILAVGQGSIHPPRLIVMEYRNGQEKPPLVVIGKAITFDAGGISLKPAPSMEEMKYDMCGGAAVMGFLQAAAEMQLPINLVGLVPTAENLPSGAAQRPGDIIKTAKGLFVEVVNTDAEGRLILADALHYADRFDPTAIIDLATLTGACVVALGSQAAGLFGNDRKLKRALRRAGDATGERVWPLPMFEEYHETLKCPVADLKNVGNRDAGASTAACFLSRFVGEGRRWAHLDIAGTARDLDGKRPHIPKGAIGFGVRLLCHLVTREKI